MEELAVMISVVLSDADIIATLSGGAAVTIYSDNAYQSADLDFVTSEGKKQLSAAVLKLGFKPYNNSRLYSHPDTDWLVEFPPGPLGFGDTIVDSEKIPLLETKYGPLRVITPTLSIMDRLSAYWYHFDNQTWDQAIEVARRQDIDWDYVYSWAKSEKQDTKEIDRLREQSSLGK
jgi:hypothetical protein